MSSIEMWSTQVEAHHAQSNSVQEASASTGDFWRRYASAFREDPSRTDDPVVNRLAREVGSETTVLDVGGGAGRLALPLALRCRHVTVVEPSASMVEQLEEGARDADITNVTTVQDPWEEADSEPADIVLCAHVLYGVADVVPFIRKLEASARDKVLVLMFIDSPQSHLAPLWEPVHREVRINLPAVPELLRVMWEIGIYPDLEMVHSNPPHRIEGREAAIEEFRQRLYVEAGTAKDRRLEEAADRLLVETSEGFEVRGARPRRIGLLAWSPDTDSFAYPEETGEADE